MTTTSSSRSYEKRGSDASRRTSFWPEAATSRGSTHPQLRIPAELRPTDGLYAREQGSIRWLRCLRRDSWVDPPDPARDLRIIHTATALTVIGLLINLAVAAYLIVAKRLFGACGGGKVDEDLRALDTSWQAIERATPPSIETAA